MGAGASARNPTDDPALMADRARPVAEVSLATQPVQATAVPLAPVTLASERKEDQDNEDKEEEPQSMSAPSASLPRAGRGHAQYQKARALLEGETKVQNAVVPDDEQIEITWDTQPNEMEARSILSVFPSVEQAKNLFRIDGLEIYQRNAYRQLEREFADEYVRMRTQNPFLPPYKIRRMMMRLFEEEYRPRMSDILFDN